MFFLVTGNLNRHKKVKHGLSETMENMEEDAVNFLGNLSDRIHDFDSSYDEQDISRDEESTADNAAEAKSPKKGRKSIPRKRVCRSSEKESAEHLENGNEGEDASEDENERLNELTYSEEERENEERFKQDGDTSKYFSISNQTVHVSGEQSVNIVQNLNEKLINTEDNTVESLLEINEQVKHDDYNEDTETETESNEPKESVVKGKRPSRKRKIKCFAEEFVGDEFGDEDIEGWNPQPTKVRKKKGANLDSLIASKFKNV